MDSHGPLPYLKVSISATIKKKGKQEGRDIFVAKALTDYICRNMNS